MYKIMALDIGTKRIGIALSDFLRVISSGYSYINRVPEDDAYKKIYDIAKENKVKIIVAGVPVNMDGSKGFQAKDCMDFASKIEGYELVFEDERLTSELAEENLREQGIDYRNEKGLVDKESARLILEQYLARL